MTMDIETASQHVYEALAHGVAGDAHRATDLLTEVGSQCDTSQMYGVCCGLAEAGAMMLRKFYGDQAPKTADDGMWVIQELRPGAGVEDPPKLFSVRFLIAWANGDHDTTMALFSAALKASGEQYIDSIAALFADVVGITRLALEKQESGR